MDAFSLKTASAYVNNLLLARGLLQNGKVIEFAKPSKGEGGTEATMAQIINIMHDLILRRDVRDQYSESCLAHTDAPCAARTGTTRSARSNDPHAAHRSHPRYLHDREAANEERGSEQAIVTVSIAGPSRAIGAAVGRIVSARPARGDVAPQSDGAASEDGMRK